MAIRRRTNLKKNTSQNIKCIQLMPLHFAVLETLIFALLQI